MSKNLSDRQRMPDEKTTKKDQPQHRQTEAMGKSQGSGLDKKKRTVNFDDGQKFTSDDDLLKRRTA